MLLFCSDIWGIILDILLYHYNGKSSRIAYNLTKILSIKFQALQFTSTVTLMGTAECQPLEHSSSAWMDLTDTYLPGRRSPCVGRRYLS